MRVDDYQLHPAKAPNRCPACGARAEPGAACVSCGYVSSRALWRRVYDDRATVARAVFDAVSPAVVLLILCTIALTARSPFAIGLALVSALATIARYALWIREQRWCYDALCVRWSYDDPRSAVSARGPCPMIEGVPMAKYSRPASEAVEISTTDGARHEAYASQSLGSALSHAVRRLHEAGAIRLFAQVFTERLAPIARAFPVAGLFTDTRYSVARGSASPPALDAMESAVLALVDARTVPVDSPPVSYRTLDAGPALSWVPLVEFHAACVDREDD